jgi:signal transduction histidine kinase
MTLLVIAIVSWLSNREIEKSLRRARRSEAELREERDNLERKVEERTRELKRAQMEQMCQLYRFAEFGKMSSGYFHDIANPLTAVSLSLERLKAQGVEELADTRVHFERALNAAKRMEDYIGAVKKQLQQQEDLKTFSPSEEIEQLIEIIGYKARKAGVAIRSRLDTEIQIFGNPIKFSQVVMNLLSNAIDSYEEVDAATDGREVTIILRREGAYAELTVKDAGCGIQAEDVERIFEPFFTTKPASSGVGIGLATVQDIVKKDFVGSVRVESTVGRGSEFIVLFPVQVARPATPEHETVST